MYAGRRGTSAFSCWLRAALIAVAFGLASAAAAESAVKSIEIRRTEDGYVVDLVMLAPVPRELAFEVLVDFEHMASWVPNVRESRVLKRDPDRATVEQQGVAHFGLLSFPFTTVREVEFAAPASIHSTQVKGSMKRLESRMSLAPDGAGTRLDYHVEMVPGGAAAVVLSKSFLEHEFREQFDAIIAEMVRRKGGAAPAPR
jgi:carbon monoxide dehydrogenase subunit G